MNRLTRAIILLFGVAAVSDAAAAHSTLRFVGPAGQRAEITGRPGSRYLRVVAHGDPSRGAGMGADCEIRAKEDGSGNWHLVPFQSEFMSVEASDIKTTSLSLKWKAPKRFVLDTNFDGCARDVVFRGTYRLR